MNVKLANVRLSFPNLFRPKAFEDGGEARYSATFLLNKTTDAAQIASIRAAAIAALEEFYGAGKVPKGIKFCLRDGSEKPDIDGYGEAVMFLTSSSQKRPPVVDRDPSVALAEEDGKPYAGCFVNASVRLWVQDNKFGKRVNAQLRAVQFVKDGESFGDKPANPTDEFSKVAAQDGDNPFEADTPKGKAPVSGGSAQSADDILN